MSFAGNVAEIYDRHLSKALFDPFAKKLVQGLPESGIALEVACGTGGCTRRLASTMGSDSTLVAIDSSESMISLASRKLVAPKPIYWLRARAEALPFDDFTFETVICGFGVMFFDDRLRALREIRRVLMPGGIFRYTVWAHPTQNAWIEVVAQELARHFPESDPTWYDAPFCFSDIQANLDVLDQAGFPEATVTPIRLTLREPDPKSLARGFIQANPEIRKLVTGRQLPLTLLESALATAFTSKFGDPIRAPMRAFMFEAGAMD